MQDKPYSTSQTSASPNETIHKHQYTAHHVLRQNTLKLDKHTSTSSECYFMSLPDESLIYITSHVADLSSLFALSRVNRRFRDLIADDTTWHRAFAVHFLGVGPENELEEWKVFMLRRSENTWMKEYIKRFNLARRWARSRSVTLNYRPDYWDISSMHLLENVALMSVSLQHGIVTRSFPLTGKILKGHLDASGTTNGLGIGNTNEEFSPNVVCIAMSSSGGTGRIAWGFRNGEVAVTSVSRIMDPNRSAACYARCRVEEEHMGEVRYISFAGNDDELLVTGCSYGEVKLWDTKRLRCLWTGVRKQQDALDKVACVKAEFNVDAGVLASAFADGTIMVWWDLNILSDGAFAGPIYLLGDAPSESRTVKEFYLDSNSSSSRAIILVHHTDERHFLRLAIDLPSGTVDRTLFGGGPLGPLTSIKVCFSVQIRRSFAPISVLSTPVDAFTSSSAITSAPYKFRPRECSFVLAGDFLGRLCVWNWEEEGISTSAKSSNDSKESDAMPQVNSSRKWEAHDDGAICAIGFSSTVIVTGSTRGTLKVWDSLSLAPLRSFSSPTPKAFVLGQSDPVGQIIVRGDLLVASVGSRVLVWQAGIITSDKKDKRRSLLKPKLKGRAIGNAMNKWQQQVELSRDIHEARRLLEDERAHHQRVYRRERAQLSTLDQLGLNEREAVEYLLMLSREEEEQSTSRLTSSPISWSVEGELGTKLFTASNDIEGVFSLDEPSDTMKMRSSTQDEVPSPILTQRAISGSHSLVLTTTEAGITHTVPVSGRCNSEASQSTPSIPGLADSQYSPQHFPAMGPPSSASSYSVPSVHLAGSWTRGSPCSSVGMGECNTRSGQPSPSTSNAASADCSSSLSTPSPARSASGNSMDEVEDEELRFVLQLSLAESRSRHEA